MFDGMRSYSIRTSCSNAALRPISARRVTARFQAAKEPRQGNVKGQFFVDSTCIDCDTCRWMAPGSFSRVGSGSAVTQQPETREERIQAIRATLSCPTCAFLYHYLFLPCGCHQLVFIMSDSECPKRLGSSGPLPVAILNVATAVF